MLPNLGSHALGLTGTDQFGVGYDRAHKRWSVARTRGALVHAPSLADAPALSAPGGEEVVHLEHVGLGSTWDADLLSDRADLFLRELLERFL